MKNIPARPTVIGAGIVVLLFGSVWALAASDLSYAASFLAATLVAGIVGVGIRTFNSPPPIAGDGATRLRELLRSTTEGRRGIRDEATGLLNRWYLERRLDEEAARCRRYGHPMAVVCLKVVTFDLAQFSLDSWQAESEEAARRCLQVVRNVDLSAALAPFEFAVCLVHCDKEGAEAAIERMLAEFSDYECRAGIAVYPEDDCEPRALIELARVRSKPNLAEAA